MTLYSKIIGTGSYLPPRRVTNDDLAAQLAEKGIETSDEWIVSRSGISARHYADPNMQSSDLAVEASKRALQMAGLASNDLDLIIVATSTPDHFGGFPSTACVVQRKLDITNGCAAVDVQAVCSGFVYAMSVADSFIKSGAHKNVLVIGTEVFSRILNFEDRTTCVLFGDGAGAIAEQHASGAIFEIQNAGKYFGADHQHVLVSAGFDETVGHGHCINEAAANRLYIDRRAAVRDVEFSLYDTGGARESAEVIRRRGGDNDQIEIVGRESSHLQRALRRLDRQIARLHIRVGVMARRDATARNDPFVGSLDSLFRELRGQVVIRYAPGRQITSRAYDFAIESHAVFC